MKSVPLLIAGSFAANAALFGALAWQPSLAPRAFRDFFTRHFHLADAPSVPVASAPAPLPSAPGLSWAGLKSDNLATLIARLRAAGFPPSVIREIIRTQVNALYKARLTALMAPDPNLPYWKVSPYGPNDSKRQEEINQLQRERAKVMRDLLSDESLATGDVTAAQRRQFGDLPRAKIDALQRIEDDYNEMISEVRSGTNGILLPEDREKLALLNREKQADLAGVLSPDELADYTLRSSPVTNLLRNRLDNFDSSEAEFRAIFTAEQAFSDRFGGNPAGMSGNYEDRQAAQQQLNSQIKAGLGDARYADFSRATSSEFQQLSTLAQRDNLPADAALTAYNLRDAVSQQSNQIYNDSTLTADQKRAELATLAQDTRTQLLNTLGPTSGPTYVKIADSSWLNNVERGSAVTFNGSNMTMSNGSAIVSIGNSSPSFRYVPVPRK